MDRWIGKVAVVTGASAGIGAAICIDLAEAGVIVVGLARRTEKVENLKKSLTTGRGELHAYYCDVTSEESVKAAFKWIEDKFGRVNILVNNAGILRSTSILAPDSTNDLRETIDTNLTGVIYCTKEAFNSLQRTGDNGHILNIGSILSHTLPFAHKLNPNGFNVYSATKHAIKALTEALRQELLALNQKVKVSMICPGIVETEIFDVANYQNADGMFNEYKHLKSEDIAQACLYILGTPAHVQIHDLIIKPVGEVF